MSLHVKRKKQSDETQDEGVKKPKQDLRWIHEGLSGPDPFTVLKQFTDQATNVDSSEEAVRRVDIVKDFLQNGGTGKEFLSLLNTEHKRKATELALIFSALEILFVRMASDLSEYRNVGVQTANSILQSHMVKLNQTLNPSANANQIKATLRLLTSMVTLGHLTAREVISHFDFNQNFISNILRWRSLADLPDVRSTYILFITSFLLEDDAVILRTIGENRAILQPLFDGIIYDSASILQVFISALRDKVASSSFLSKTLKLRIFNAYTNQQLTNLFYWQGPTKAPRKTIKGDQPTSEISDSDADNLEDRIAVAELGQSLFLSLTSSHKYGLVFADYALGLGAKNKNNAALILLQNLTHFWEYPCEPLVELQSVLVVRTMQSCPDLMRWYLPPLSESLADVRPTKPWFRLCHLVQRIVDSQNLEIIFNPREKFTVKQQAMRGAALIAPLIWDQTFFPSAMDHDDFQVKLAVGHLLLTVLQKTAQYRHILLTSHRTNVYTVDEKSAIFTSYKNLVLKRLLPPTTLIELSDRMFTTENEDQQKTVEFWSLVLELETLYLQLGFFTDEERSQIMAGRLMNNVMDRVKKAGDDANLLEPLQLSVFRFVSSLPGIYDMNESQLESLTCSLVNCIVSTKNAQLRQSSAVFLRQILVKGSGWNLSSLELNVWLQSLEDFPTAAPLFRESCLLLLCRRSRLMEKLATDPSVTESEGCGAHLNPLLLAAWEKVSQERHPVEELRKFFWFAMCGLIHCQLGDAKSFASSLVERLPPNLKEKSFKQYVKMWTAEGKPPSDCANLGFSSLSALLFECAFHIRDDNEAMKNRWHLELSANCHRLDKLELVLHQALKYLSLDQMRNSDQQFQILELIDSILAQDQDCSSDSLTGLFLQHPSTVQWFDPMDFADLFVSRFTSLVHRMFHKFKLPSMESFKTKLVDSIRQSVGNATKKNRKKATKLFQTDQMLSFIDLFGLQMSDLEPLITLIIQSPKSVTELWIPLLDCLLLTAARLRLTGQKINEQLFHQVLQLFIELGAARGLRGGLKNLISVCPELVDDFSQANQDVLQACLDSQVDGTDLCLLLINNCPKLGSTFSQWCLEHEDVFRDINWRLQVIPALCSDRNGPILELVHTNLSSQLSSSLLDRSKYQQTLENLKHLNDLYRILVQECWDVDYCREIANQLLGQHKTGLAVWRFAPVARKSGQLAIHAKLCLRSAVWLLKTAGAEAASQLKELAREMDWIVSQCKSRECSTTSSILTDDSWAKFLKYSLRIGLETSSESQESELSSSSLALIVSVWTFLAIDTCDQVLAACQQVYQMMSSHSDFVALVLDEEGLHIQQKTLLLRLMIVLIDIHPKLCQSGHIPLLLASYQATRSTNDQLILKLLQTYEKNGVALAPFKPYLWGSAAAAHYSLQKGSSMRLLNQPEAGEVVALLESDKLLKTANHFPIDSRFDRFDDEPSSDYDPRFLLPLLAHVLSSQYVVHCAKLTQSGAVSLVLAALSSHCDEVRSFAWLALARLYDQLLAASNWPDRCLWLHMIECLRLGAVEQYPNLSGRQHPPVLPNIIALFMARAAAILRDPAHPMYRPINNFLVVKPVMDVTQVPEFLQLLHSTDLAIQRNQQKTFVLNLIRDGVRTPRDYLVCARRRVFRLLLSLQPSALLTDEATKILILEVVQSAVRHPIIAYDLILNRGLMAWISGLLAADLTAGETQQLLQLLRTMWDTLDVHLQRKRSAQEKSEVEVVAELDEQMVDADEPKKEPEVPKKTRERSKKPIWDQLPQNQQVLSPWLVFEWQQILLRLWPVLVQHEIDSSSFQTFVRLVCNVSSHIYESKKQIDILKKQQPGQLIYVSPSRTLRLSVLEQLVDVAPRFQSHLPDLKEHLDDLRTCGKFQSDPAHITAKWHQRYVNMAELDGGISDSSSTRRELHHLIALAQCGV